jgi:hypothetical protein
VKGHFVGAEYRPEVGKRIFTHPREQEKDDHIGCGSAARS